MPVSPSSACRCSPTCWHSRTRWPTPWHGCSGTDWPWSWRCSPPTGIWRPSPADQAKLLGTWRSLAPAAAPVRSCHDVSRGAERAGVREDPDAWARLQHQAVLTIRAALPRIPSYSPGADWGSVAGLLSLPPEPDPNVIYSFHLYEPAELTALGAYRTGLDAAAMARLPFPVTDARRVRGHRRPTRDPPTAGLMRFYCAQHWDVAKLTARIAEAGAWARRASRCCAGGGIRRLAAAERAGAPGLARRRARGLRAAGDRLGAVGL